MRYVSLLAIGIFSLAAMVLISGCVTGTMGNQKLTGDRVAQIKKGVTTRQEVENLFGPPMSLNMMGDGRRMMMYSGGQYKRGFGGTFFSAAVPVVGAVIPTTDTQNDRRQMLQIILSKADIVEDYEYSDNTTKMDTTTSAFGGHMEETTIQNAPQK